MNSNKSVLSRVDGTLFLIYFTIVVIGIFSIFSVEYRVDDTYMFSMSKSFMKQALFFGISLFIGLIIIYTDSKAFNSFAFLFYVLGLLLLIVTIFIGKDIKGSRSWLYIGGFGLQPGEICKIFTSLALAKYLTLMEVNYDQLKYRLISYALILAPAVIIILQSETGLALVYFCFFLVLYRNGLPIYLVWLALGTGLLAVLSLVLPTNTMLIVILSATGLSIYLFRDSLKRFWRTRFILIGAFIIAIGFSQFALPFVLKNVFKNYQLERIYAPFGMEVPEEYLKFDSDEDRLNRKTYSNYNVMQSMIAIGSGGFLGKGYLNGTSTKNDFVPEQHTDFIFCSVGEQFGFLGSLVLIGLYLALLLRIVNLAECQKSQFTQVYAYCVAAIIFFHLTINIGMTIGVMPVIGITLPLMSYGGSSLVSFSVLIFILLRLDSDRKVLIR